MRSPVGVAPGEDSSPGARAPARRTPRAVAGVLAVAVLAGSGVYGVLALAPGESDSSSAVEALPVPTYPAPPPPPAAAAVRELPVVPPPGTVAVLAGPFTDRVRFDGLRLRVTEGGSRVSGSLVVTSDVSDLIVAEVVVAFYDERGRLLDAGTAVLRDEHAGGEGPGSAPPTTRTEGEPHPFQVRGPRGVASATVGLPTLVNE